MLLQRTDAKTAAKEHMHLDLETDEFCMLHPDFPELLARRRPWTT